MNKYPFCPHNNPDPLSFEKMSQYSPYNITLIKEPLANNLLLAHTIPPADNFPHIPYSLGKHGRGIVLHPAFHTALRDGSFLVAVHDEVAQYGDALFADVLGEDVRETVVLEN